MEDPDTVVVAAGEGPDVSRLLPAGAAVIAADGGLERATALGLEVALVVGDLDSASPEAVEAARSVGTAVRRHPVDKDATDLELALDEAIRRGARRLLVVASAEGRLDHLLSSLLVLGAERYAAIEIDALVGPARIHVIRGTRVIDGEPGELVTLLALHGAADGVTTDGLAYPLRGERLEAGSSRGVSNVLTSGTATIEVGRGVLLAVRAGPGVGAR